MNEDHWLPSEPEDMKGNDAGEREGRLGEVERRLKMLQPCPVRFDIAALEDAASSGDAHIAHTRQRAGGRRGWVGIAAGSWACGAMAGALVTFVILGHSTTGEVPPAKATVLPAESSERVAESDHPDAAEPLEQGEPLEQIESWNESDFSISALLLDSRQGGFGDSRRVLRVGSHLPAFREMELACVHEPRPVMRRNTDVESPRPREQVAEPATPATYDQLRHELLGNGPESLF